MECCNKRVFVNLDAQYEDHAGALDLSMNYIDIIFFIIFISLFLFL